ncbi:universal stress protein [Roseibium marinum]|uniref:Nucleotide-binding universal stress UspA family protein n=1 Tax=Roseibium marinum TaxID=281252 RepID=A0A2S3UU43_9HYPH|nr:universal stress protein [Roseibium marinum]POF30989.1 nucleotide-binding universal stress UspA family protein [Roseibium marinum]
MFKKILIPIDLSHADKLEKSVSTAAYLAKIDDIPIVFAAVTSAAPGALGHTPDEFRARLDSFAATQAEKHGVTASGHAVFSHDPAVDLDHALLKAIHESGADLVVMQTHIPHLSDHFWPSNGGRIATHSDVSVFLVR